MVARTSTALETIIFIRTASSNQSDNPRYGCRVDKGSHTLYRTALMQVCYRCHGRGPPLCTHASALHLDAKLRCLADGVKSAEGITYTVTASSHRNPASCLDEDAVNKFLSMLSSHAKRINAQARNPS